LKSIELAARVSLIDLSRQTLTGRRTYEPLEDLSTAF
jgi:hypothetical protein